jgi:hypothetical protein
MTTPRVWGVLEIAQWLADLKKQGKLTLKRDVIFAAWSGEELGLLGSNHFVEAYAKMIKGDPECEAHRHVRRVPEHGHDRPLPEVPRAPGPRQQLAVGEGDRKTQRAHRPADHHAE